MEAKNWNSSAWLWASWFKASEPWSLFWNSWITSSCCRDVVQQMWGLFSLLCSLPTLIPLTARKVHFWSCSHSNSSCHGWEKSSQILGELNSFLRQDVENFQEISISLLKEKKGEEKGEVSLMLRICSCKNFLVFSTFFLHQWWFLEVRIYTVNGILHWATCWMFRICDK